jgi:hypothetical protein
MLNIGIIIATDLKLPMINHLKPEGGFYYARHSF